MRRVVVIGNGGAGKSTFARELGRRTGLPVIHLDVEHWRPGWVAPPRPQWQRHVAALVQGDRWIIDGNYSGSFDLRFAAADTVVFLDTGRWRCAWRAATRVLRQRDRTRTDLAPGCRERVDLEFLRWVWNYPRDSRPKVLAALSRHAQLNVVHLKSRRDGDRFLTRVIEYSA